MQDDTIKLLQEVDSGCKMAMESIEQIGAFNTSSELAHVAECYRQKHQEILSNVKNQLREYHEFGKEPGVVAAAMSKTTTQVKMMLREDSHQAAKILMDGCNMGIQSVSEYLNKYKMASKESIAAAKDLIRTEEDFMCDLKKFL